MERTELANQYHEQGYSCAQAVACVFADVVGMPVEQLAALCGAFGGGFRAEELCGVVSGAAVVIGAKWPHRTPEDQAAKALAAEKMRDFHSRFFQRFPSLVCRDLKPLPATTGEELCCRSPGDREELRRVHRLRRGDSGGDAGGGVTAGGWPG